jgi:hypothetical protein
MRRGADAAILPMLTAQWVPRTSRGMMSMGMRLQEVSA